MSQPNHRKETQTTFAVTHIQVSIYSSNDLTASSFTFDTATGPAPKLISYNIFILFFHLQLNILSSSKNLLRSFLLVNPGFPTRFAIKFKLLT